MKKLLIPFLFLSAVVGFMACHKEISSDPLPDKALSMLALNDSTPHDTIPHDTIPHDTIPHDTSGHGGGIKRDTILPLTADQIHITPSKIDSGGVSGLALSAITANNYPCSNNYLLTGLATFGGNYTLFFPGVNIPANCSGGLAQAQGTRTLFSVNDGSHVFKVVLNGITYTGSFVKTGSQYTFTWPYTSGVTISPLTIN
ncbi:MAG TPA: hypothetical protein VF008_16095 [Niastella sp.]